MSRIGDQLAQLLTSILPTSPPPVNYQEIADRVTMIFQRSLQVGGTSGQLPPILDRISEKELCNQAQRRFERFIQCERRSGDRLCGSMMK